jgi:hypothetical protein
MNAKSSFKPLLVAGAVAAALISGAPAQAATGTTSISVTLNPVVILHYFSSVGITISGADLTAYMYSSGDSKDEGSNTKTTSGSMTVSLAMSPTGPTGSLSALPLVLTDAWAVRAINTTTNQTQLAITGGGTLTNAAGGTIAIGTARVDAANGSGGAATIAFAPPGLVTPETGSIVLPLDLTSANHAGAYTGGSVTLTATSL